MEVSLPQIIYTKMHTKTACSSRVIVLHVNRKILQFFKRYFFKFYQIKALEFKYFCKFIGKFCNANLTLKDFK